MHVLVVDDEPDLRLILQINLRRWGHEVTTAGDAAAAAVALQAAADGRAAPIDALLLDVSMPGETGVELLDRLRPTGVLPSQIALLSAMVVGERPPGGADVRFLAKPFGVDDLQQLVTAMAAASSA